jgi:hypothetical protein
MQNTPNIPDPLAPLMRQRVSRIMQSHHAAAVHRICSIAAGGRTDWSHAAWSEMLRELDRCELSLADWLVCQ